MRELLMMAGVAFLITLVLTPIIRDVYARPRSNSAVCSSITCSAVSLE